MRMAATRAALTDSAGNLVQITWLISSLWRFDSHPLPVALSGNALYWPLPHEVIVFGRCRTSSIHAGATNRIYEPGVIEVLLRLKSPGDVLAKSLIKGTIWPRLRIGVVSHGSRLHVLCLAVGCSHRSHTHEGTHIGNNNGGND